MKPWLQRRAELGIYINLFQELLEAKLLKDYIRMDTVHFDYLVETFYPYLIKPDSIMRENIKPNEQWCLFLRYVASAETFRSLEYKFQVNRKSIARLVERVVEAIIEELQDEYLRTPATITKWLEISENCSQQRNFPNSIGTIDGKHIILDQPKNLVHIIITIKVLKALL